MSELIQPRREQAVDLRDGRQIGVSEFGAPDGNAILWFHGTPGARRQIPPMARRRAEADGLRIVGVERPGVGESTPHLYHSIAGWTLDVEQVTDSLGIDEFGIVGLSGGGPYTLACAHDLPDRVVAGVVLGGVAPATGPEAAAGGIVRLATLVQAGIALTYDLTGTVVSTLIRSIHPIADSVFDLYARFGPASDRAVLERPDMREFFMDDILNGTHTHTRAIVSDLVLFGRQWGFSLRDIERPVRFYQGDADALVPFSHGAHQAALVPRGELIECPGEGHLGLLDSADGALDFILGAWTADDQADVEVRA